MTVDILEAAGLLLAGSAILAGLALAFDRLAPARFVRERHDLALAAFLVTPLLFAIAMQPAPAPRDVPVLLIPQAGTETVPAEAQDMAEPAAFAATAGPATPRGAAFDPEALLPLFPLVWLAGSLWMAVRLGRDLLALRRLRTRAVPASLPPGYALSGPAAIARSAEIPAPLLAGYLRPVILLPQDFPIDAAARPVLEHELAHAARGDAWTVLLQRLVTAAFWWVLPLHLLQPVIGRSREMLCDRRSVQLTGAPQTLATALLDAAACRAAAPSLALAAAPSRSDLAQRVRHLAAFDLTRTKDTAMRFALILPALAAGTVIFTPHVGAARESVVQSMPVAYAPERRLDDALDADGSLFVAAARGWSDRVQQLLASGADPNVRFSGDGTPLIAAVASGDARSVQLLLEAGANPDLGVAGDGNPMIAAAVDGNRAMVEMLLEAGADIDAAEIGDGNALIAASQRGHADLVRFLLQAGADPEAYVPGDETPLINAAQQGHVDIAELLVEAGADVSLTVPAPRWDGEDRYRSPISEARRNGRGAMVRWLEARGAEHRPPAE